MAPDNLKAGFRSEIKDYTKRQTRDGDFDNYNDFQKSQWMTRAYLNCTLRQLNPGLVPEDDQDREMSMCDGPSDAAVDFLCRQDNHVLIIQAKYRKQGKIEPEQDFEHFCGVLSRLHPTQIGNYRVSQRVRELAAEIDWDTDTFDLHYITTGRASDNIRAREQTGQVEVSFAPGLAERVEIAFYEESDLNQRLREAQSAGEQIQEPVELQFSATGAEPLWLKYKSESGRISYIGYVKAAQLRNLYARHRYRLFAQNIRNYIGDTSTNKGIVETALNEPAEFFFYNNGIAAVATKIEEAADRRSLRLERFSVINGAQTVRSLAKAHTKDSSRCGSAGVLVRVSLVSLRHSDAEEAFLDKITRFNNTQNAVKVSDFRSNDAVQRGLAKKFATLSRGGKEYWYKNKRVGDRDPRKIPIAMEEFAKTVFAFRFGPADVHGGTSHLFDTSKDGGYAKVFGVGGILPTIIEDSSFELLAGTWFLCEQLRLGLDLEKTRLTSNQPEADQATVRHALERRWMLFYVAGEALRRRYELARRSLDDDLRRLAKPKWLDDAGSTREAVAKYARLSSEVLVKLYKAASQQSSFAHRNWFRSTQTLTSIATELQYSSFVIEGLPLLRAGERTS